MKLQIGKQYNCVTAGNWRFKVLDNGVDIECSNGNYYGTIQEVVTNEFSV